MIEHQLLKQFKNHFRSNGRVFSAPGKINILGEQTEPFQGDILASVINQKFYVVLAKRGGLDPFPIVRILSSKMNDICEFNLFSHPPKQWMNYFWAVMKVIESKGYQCTSFDLYIHSDIPVGAGLSSSAALCAAFAKALNGLFNFGFTLQELAQIGFEAESGILGLSSRFVDHFITIFGINNTLLRVNCQTFEYEYIPFVFPQIKFAVFNSRVKESYTDFDLNARKQSVAQSIEKIKSQNSDILHFKDISLNLLMENKKLIDPIDYNRIQFLIEEQNRVLNLCIDLKNNDLTSFHYLLYASHEGLRDQYDVSCQELDFIVEAAQNTPGIIGAKMAGKGFGGSIVVVIEANQYDNAIKLLSEKFEKKYLKTAIYYHI
ncbi:MAG: galactokinase family protein [Bacteroidales bacterium]|jgi:galactokinase|nr:galactokinase family protein [Bacteroidales bacterium]